MPNSLIEALTGSPLGWIVAAVWGALWGSFFNVVIYRLGRVAVEEEAHWEARSQATDGRLSFWEEEKEHFRWIGRALYSLLTPRRSFCPSCQATIAGHDNIPIVSWLVLRGRCRHCKSPISPRYVLVELAGLILALGVYARFVAAAPDAAGLQLGRFFIYSWFAGILLVLTIIDLDSMLLPDAITYPAIPGFFLLGRLLPDVSLVDAVLGVVVGYGGLTLLTLVWRLVTGRDALGGGDAKLLALAGGLLGWKALPWMLFGGALLGIAVALPLLLRQRRRGQAGDAPLTQVPIPFGPFLAAGALVYLFFGQPLSLWLAGSLVE